MPGSRKRLPAAFYRSPVGGEPVRDWLKSLDQVDRKILGDDIRLLEFGWPLGMPLCRSLGLGLWEIRSDLTGGRIARVIFCVAKERMVLLHGFIKKSKKMSRSAFDLARKRKKELD